MVLAIYSEDLNISSRAHGEICCHCPLHILSQSGSCDVGSILCVISLRLHEDADEQKKPWGNLE